MAFYYQLERKIMEGKFKQTKQYCLEAGMSDEAIEEIHDLYLEELNNNRKYCTHNQSLTTVDSYGDEMSDESWSPLYKSHLEQFSVCQPEISEWGRYDWIDDLDTSEIIAWVKKLSDKDMEIATYLIEGSLKKKEIAENLGCSPSAISDHLNRMREKLGKILSRN